MACRSWPVIPSLRRWDNTSSGFSSFADGGINKYNQRPEWAVSGADEPNTLKVSGTYELPIGPGKTYFNNKGVTGQIVGGWQVGWITRLRGWYRRLRVQQRWIQKTALHSLTASTGRTYVVRIASVKLSTASYSRADEYFSGKIASAQIFNAGAFAATPSQFVLGDAIRNYAELRNPANYNEDVNVRKHFYFGERFQGILQVDYFNVFNRTRFFRA